MEKAKKKAVIFGTVLSTAPEEPDGRLKIYDNYGITMRTGDVSGRNVKDLKMSRLFEITYLLLGRGPSTARTLAERFEVSTRTIYRDVERLSAAGIPVYMEKGRNGGIGLLPGFTLDKTVLSQEEREEVLSALNGLGAAGYGEEGKDGALTKLASLFGDSGGGWIEVDFSGWGWGREARENFDCLKAAVLGRRAVAFTYYGSAGEGTSRVAEPLKLVFRGQAWYLYGWCRLRSDFRFFKLSRMEDVTPLEEVFTRPAPARVTDEVIPGNAPDTVAVVFRADPAVAFRLFDEFPHDRIRREPDGSFFVGADMPGGDWLVSYYLTYGNNAEILEPASLRAEIGNVLRAAADKYI